jgi:hypothetical protein
MTEAKNTMTIGADGEVMHSLHAGKAARSPSLLKTSPVNKKLSLAYNAQSLSSSLWGNNVILVRNNVSGDTTVARTVAFQKQPDHANAKVGATFPGCLTAAKSTSVRGVLTMEFEINSVITAPKLSVFDQLKVCRKLLPVLSSIVPDLAATRDRCSDRR